MKRVPCSHCAVPHPPGDLVQGFCRTCFTDEGPATDPEREAEAVAMCRGAGLRAVPRPCGDERCHGCAAILAGQRKRTTPIDRGGRYQRRTVEFNERDADALKAYFNRPQPSVPGDGSAFGAMVARIGESTNPDTKERPTSLESVCPSREPVRFYDIEVGGRIVQVQVMQRCCPVAFESHISQPKDHVRADDDDNSWAWAMQASYILKLRESHAGKFGSWDDQAANYIDRRRQADRTNAVLDSLTRMQRDVLEARYGSNLERSAKEARIGDLAAVCVMTPTLRRLRNERAFAGETEAVDVDGPDGKKVTATGAPTARGILLAMSDTAASSTVSKVVRGVAVAQLDQIRKEAEALVKAAEKAYAEAS